MSFEVYRIVKHSNKEYHGNKEYIGSTSLKKYGESPAHYLEARNNPKEATEAMIFGSVYHTLVLEEELFQDEVFILDESKRPVPDKNYQTKANADWKREQFALNQHKYCISSDQHKELLLMKSVLEKNTFAMNLLRGEREISYYVNLDGAKVKIRPDSRKKDAFKADLKTCNDASPEAFKRHAYDMGYHVSAALYSDILDLIYEPEISEGFFFVAQEKTAPYTVAVYIASEQFIAQGRHEYQKYLEMHRRCLESGNYPGYEVFSNNDNGVFELSLPSWGMKELQLSI